MTAKIVAAASPEAAKRLAQRTDEPLDLGPASNPDRAAAGWRRYGWADTPAPPPKRIEDVIPKVRKLLTLASNHAATEAEAATAAAAAQKLIEQYHLDTALLDAEPQQAQPTEQAHAYHEPLGTWGKKIVWRGKLARVIAEANGCSSYWERTKDGLFLRLIGTPSRVAGVRQLYTWLATEIDRLGTAAATGKGQSYGRAWRIGCASRVGERLKEAARLGREEARQQAIGAGASIVRVNAALATLDAAAADTARVVRSLGLRNTYSAPVRVDGYKDGRQAGDRIKLSGHAALGRGTDRLRGDQ